MASLTAKSAEVMFEKALETHEEQMDLLPLVDFVQPDGAQQQNSGNVIWTPVQQHAPVISGWDLTGQETGIIEEEYPMILGVPSNDFVQVRADDLRDKRFWEKRGKTSGRRQVSELNKQLAIAAMNQAGMFIRSNAADGYSFIAEAQALMNERQLTDNGRCFILNDRDQLKFSKDLAGKQTMQGRPENEAWSKGQIGANVADFNIFTSSALPNLDGGSSPAVTVTGNHSFAPESGSVDEAAGTATNVDYRNGTLIVSDSSDYTVGDKFIASNSGVPVKAIGLEDKNDTGQAMTFTIKSITDGTHIVISPKPIAADDAALSTLEKAYANVDTTILNAATLTRMNIDTANKVNLFWDKEAIQVCGGTIPANLFAEFDGMKELSSTMPNGQTMYMFYDGSISTMNFRYRLFTWYGITIANPSAVGVAVTY
jgi:hypothetical protein